MKTHARFLALLALVCGLTLARGQVTLELKHPPETTHAVATEITVQQTLTLAGMAIDTKSVQSRLTQSSAGKRENDGSLRIRDEVKKLNARISLPGGIQVEFDSANPNTKAPMPELEPLLDVMRATLKASTTRVYDKDGALKEVESDRRAFEGLDPKVKPDLSPAKAKRDVEQIARILPDKAMNKGDTWVRKEAMDLGGGQMMRFQMEYEYKGAVRREGRELDVIEAKATSVDYELDANSPLPLKLKNSELKVAGSKTKLLFDRELGVFLEIESSVRITGDMTFEVAGNELPGKLDLTISTKSALQTAPSKTP